MTDEQRSKLSVIIHRWRWHFNMPLPKSSTLCVWARCYELAVIEEALGAAGHWWLRKHETKTPDQIAAYASEYASGLMQHIDLMAYRLDRALTCKTIGRYNASAACSQAEP